MVSPLFPVFSPAPIVTDPEPPDRLFGTGFKWNFEEHDFVLDGNGRPEEIDEKEQFAQWIVLALLIQRFAYPIYSSEFGIDKERLVGIDTNIAEAETQIVIEDALVNVDQRVYLVQDFEFERSGTTLNVEFRVVPVEGSPIPQTFSVEG